jgi:hypothetical protein
MIVSIVSSISGFPLFAARSQANYPGIERTMETKSCTNKFCLKRVSEGFDLLEYGDRGKEKECASVRLASSGIKDRAANYGKPEIEQPTTEMKLCPRQTSKYHLKKTFVYDGEPIKVSIMSAKDIGRNIQAVFCKIPVRK